MKKHLLDNEHLKRASLYITAAALCLLIVCVFFKIWHADLRVPFYYSGDAAFFATSTKGVMENGWYWQNPSLGAPDGQQIYDFPGFDNAVVLVMLLLSVFTHNPFLVTNIYYLLTFPLITLTSLYVLRQFNLSYVPALFCSLLYAFLPYHFMRNESSLNVAAYYVVPLATMVVLWVMRNEVVPRTRKFIIGVLVCLLLGSSGVYFPFFFCFLLLLAGITGSLRIRNGRPLLMAVMFTGITVITVGINLSPSIIYKYKHHDVGVMKRGPGEAEKYGLKISQLLLPINGHRIELFDRLKQEHNRNAIVNEDDTSALGLIASIGFLALLAQLLYRKDAVNGAAGLLNDLSVLNIFSVLLAIMGGFGLLFALYISSAIRSYNRISVWIAFFSFTAVAVGLESIYRRTANARIVFCILLAVVFVGAFLDQTTSGYVPSYTATKAEFLSDDQFVKSIEASVPAGAMIFQLPYIPFPEFPKVNRMDAYDHFRGYLHSRNLRWSYGAIKNRDGDRAQQRVAVLPAEEFVKTLVMGGFSGIYLDRFGYEDGGAAREAELSNLLQTAPLISSNNRLVFFNLADYGRRLRANYSDDEWKARQQTSFYPVLVDWKGGFSGLESRPGKTWRWCSSEGELVLRNTSQRPRTVKLEMSFATGYEQLDDFVITGLISEQLKLNSSPAFYSKTVTLPPGVSVIHFRSAAKRVDAPGDDRVLVFRVEDFKMTELQ